MKRFFVALVVLILSQPLAGQQAGGTNVFTGGLFMPAGRWEAKFYNNLFTQREPQYAKPDMRSSFNTSFMQLTFGSTHNINVGFDVLYRSNITNAFANSSPFAVFAFMNKELESSYMGETTTALFSHGLANMGPRIRTKPFKNKKFTLQQSVYLPVGAMGNGWIINTDLFFEHVHNGKYMIFGDLGLWYPLDADPFPYARLFAGTLLASRFGPFVMVNLPYELGLGTKIFITRKIELEFMYSKWLPWQFIVEDRRPATFNFGLRVTNFNNF